VGAFRLLLAVSVMLGHLSFYPHALPDIIPGQTAVEGFYIVSGFLITLVLTEKYSERLFLFYTNRLLRIYPIYWACFALYLLANIAVLQGYVSTVAYASLNFPNQGALWWSLNHPIELAAKIGVTFVNIFIVGQDMVRALGGASSDYFYFHFVYIRVAWTIAIELSFYAIAPFVVRRVSLTAGLLVASFCAERWIMARVSLNPAAYELFPFALWCFMAGALAYHLYSKLRAAKPPGLLAYGVVATAIAIALTVSYNMFSVPRVVYLAVIAVCLPGIVLLGRKNPWDSSFGDLSYPLYLIHPLALIVILPGAWAEFIAIPAIIVLSLLMVHGLERPIERYRQRRIRQVSGTAVAAPAVSGR
jgi:peptidoglycan/LPS O-acetylase OafA/YrhL